MNAHEIAGVLVASIVAVVIVRAFAPGSTAGTLVQNSLSGWSGVLQSIGGQSPAWGGQ